MSSPISRRSPSPSAASSVSGSSTSSSSSGSSSPARGLYVPLHKRSAPSSTTSVSAKSESSRPCSPSNRRTPGSPTMHTPQTAHPRIYTTGYLLSLRPFATEGLKEKMRVSCPEVVMNRRMRKSIEFNEHQARSAMKREQLQQQQSSPTLPPPFLQAPIHEEAYEEARDNIISTTIPQPALTAAFPAPASTTPRVTPRRARPAGRAPERRRQALHHDAWHGLRNTGTPMPLVSV